MVDLPGLGLWGFHGESKSTRLLRAVDAGICKYTCRFVDAAILSKQNCNRQVSFAFDLSGFLARILC